MVTVWRSSAIDPTTDVAASAVLDAFDAAREAGSASVDCYRAGVEAWRRTHPDQAAEYAAKQAVAVILDAHADLGGEDHCNRLLGSDPRRQGQRARRGVIGPGIARQLTDAAPLPFHSGDDRSP